jgi:hypothetical protein
MGCLLCWGQLICNEPIGRFRPGDAAFNRVLMMRYAFAYKYTFDQNDV